MKSFVKKSQINLEDFCLPMDVPEKKTREIHLYCSKNEKKTKLLIIGRKDLTFSI